MLRTLADCFNMLFWIEYPNLYDCKSRNYLHLPCWWRVFRNSVWNRIFVLGSFNHNLLGKFGTYIFTDARINGKQKPQHLYWIKDGHNDVCYLQLNKSVFQHRPDLLQQNPRQTRSSKSQSNGTEDSKQHNESSVPKATVFCCVNRRRCWCH